MANKKIIYTLEYLTQIHTSWSGKEQRAALRTRPRRSISYDYIGCDAWQSQWLRMLSFATQNELIQFPLWHAPQVVKETIYRGQMQVYVKDEMLWDYNNVGSFIIWTDDKKGGFRYDIRYMTADGYFGLTKEMDRNWKVGSFIYPVVWTSVRAEDSVVELSSDVTTNVVNLEIIEEQRILYPEYPASSDEWHDEPVNHRFGTNFVYQEAEVFMQPVPWLDELRTTYSKNVNRLDNKSGVYQYDLKSPGTNEVHSFTQFLTTLPEVHNMMRFFYRHKGRLKSFFLPNWRNDIELFEDAPAGQQFLVAKQNWYWKFYSKSLRRRKLMVFFRDGTVKILEVAAFSLTDDGMQSKIFLDSPLDAPLRKSDVEMITFLLRVRFTSDTLSLDYETTYCASFEFSATEVDE